MKLTLAYDWCILILACLARRKTLKDDVKRWMSKDWCYALPGNTESECLEHFFASFSARIPIVQLQKVAADVTQILSLTFGSMHRLVQLTW